MADELETREKRILEFLLKGPKTAQDLAKELSVSRRTILRDLPSLEEKLKKRGLFLERKAGKGIKLRGPDSAIENLSKELSKKTLSEDRLPAKERQILVLLNLIEKKGIEKLYTFARELRVTEATISYDLDQLEGILGKYELKIIRKPGLGVFLEGEEKNKRALLADLIYEQFNESELIELLKSRFGERNAPEEDSGDIIDEVKLRLLKFIEKDLINDIEEVLREITEEFDIKLADSAFAGLLVHIVLSVARLKKGEKITMEKNVLATLEMTREFQIARSLGKRMEEKGIFQIPEEELGYITMHLLGAKIREREGFDEIFYFINDDEALKMAEEIFINAGKVLQKEINKDNKAVKDLALHLKPAIARLRLKMDIRNPLLFQLKEKYSDLMEICKRAVEPLENRLLIKFPESEIGFIAMHVGAAVERMKRDKKYSVILVCPTGIGSSKMLYSRVEKELPHLKVLDAVSLLELDGALAKYPGVDLVISTIPIELPRVKTISVSPLLTKNEVEKINTLLNEIENHSAETENAEENSDYPKEELKDAIFNLIEKMVFIKEIAKKNIEGLMDEVIKYFNDVVVDGNLLKEDLKRRMELSGCGVPGTGVYLLHAKSRSVREPLFGVFGTKEKMFLKNMDGQKEGYRDFVLMLLPTEGYKKTAEVFARISVLILEDKEFLTALKGQNESLFIKILLKKLK
ncbi:PRD domain-containing protein [Thermovenabulum gondwanense]|nr:PRD domain-containing protein [Thermovenabulum gondwanense]